MIGDARDPGQETRAGARQDSSAEEAIHRLGGLDVVPETLEPGREALDQAADLWIETGRGGAPRDLERQGDPQPPARIGTLGISNERLGRWRRPVAVGGVVPCHHVEEQRGVD